ncbi:hypothetical protein D4R87_00030 [bacterium]|nr:MAG: hypothetical protein D4R87_00030 [bacterium]
MRKYYISIFILFASLIAGQLVRIPIFGKIFLVSDIVIIGFLAWRIFVTKDILRKMLINYLFIPTALFVGFSVLSLAIAARSIGVGKALLAGLYLGRWLLYILTAFALADFPNKNKTRDTVFWGIIASALILAILGFFQLAIFPDFAFMVKYGWDPHQGRLLSTWFDPNFLAGFFAIALAFISAKILYCCKKNKDFWLMMGLGGIIYLAAILTYSRSGYMALLTVFITLCFLRFSPRFFAYGIVLALATLLIFPRSYQRMMDASIVDATTQMRIESWDDTREIIKEHTLFGVGFNTLQWQWSTEKPDHAQFGSDSSLLTIWATTGIFGLFAFLWILWIIAHDKLRILWSCTDVSDKIFAMGSFAAILALLVHSTFVNSLLYPHIAIMIWLIAGTRLQ